MIQNGDVQDKSGARRAPHGKTAYGRRVTSKTFTILGASTPEFRISTMGASRKMKIWAQSPKTGIRRAAVPKMHNGSLWQSGLIARDRGHYVSVNATDSEHSKPDNKSIT